MNVSDASTNLHTHSVWLVWLQASDAPLLGLAARHDGCLLAVSDADSRVHIWDVRKVSEHMKHTVTTM